MTVTEIKQAVGSWDLRLHSSTPRELLDKLTYYGHLVVAPGRLDVREYGDSLLASARYVGVFLERDAQNEFILKGGGMAFWLGDTDDKGDLFETPVELTAETFADSVRALLPPGGGVAEGTLFSVAGTYTGKHVWETPRKSITYVTDTFGAEWRMNYNGTLDAGTVAQLYRTTPTTILMQRQTGADLLRKALPGRMSMSSSVGDYTTRVVLLAEGEGSSITTGEADLPVIPYKDLFGNPIRQTRVVSESGTVADNADARAALALNSFAGNRNSVDLSSSAFDIKGDLVVGDYVDVYDPINGFMDPAREVIWEGQPINPMALRCVELTWPIAPGWTVAFRTTEGEWIDLSPYYAGETGETTIVVGELPRSVSGIGSEGIGIRPNLPESDTPSTDTTIPGVPVFTGFSTGIYETLDRSLAAIQAAWSQPLNVDGSTILDGDHYEIRYRPNEIIGAPVAWDILSGGYALDYDEQFNTPVTGGLGSGWALIGAGSEFNVVGGEAQVTHPTTDTLRGAYRWNNPQTPRVEIRMDSSIDYMPNGGSTVMGSWFRFDGNNYYWWRVEPNTDASVTLKLWRYKASVFTEVVSMKVPGMVHTPGVRYHSKATLYDDTLTYKVWQGTTSDEPQEDQVNYWDQDPITGTGCVGFFEYLVFGSTNAGGFTRHSYIQARSLDPDNVANAYSWDELGTWDAPTSEPVAVTQNWATAYAGWNQTAYTISELGAGIKYELQIRAVDSASPPHQGAWSASSYVDTSGDVIAPSNPAAPIVAASMIAVQIEHRLGKSTGGIFNLEQDLAKLEVHASHTPTFSPDASTKVGDLIATGAMVRGGIPAVGTFKVDQAGSVWIRVVAVDRMGNSSGPSDAVQSSVELIDDAHISSLTVSKLTAGTITADMLLAAEMEVGAGGNIKLTEGSLDVYNAANVKVVEAGLLADSTYGLAAVDPATGALGKLSDLIFGPKVDEVSNVDPCTVNGSWVDLDTFGPQVVVNVGSTGRVLIFLTCRYDFNGNSTQSGGMMSFAASGANTITPSSLRANISTFSVTNGTLAFIIEDRKTATVFMEGLNPGLTTFTCKYQKYFSGGGNLQFMDREIAVFPY